jgi:hypothetical protein
LEERQIKGVSNLNVKMAREIKASIGVNNGDSKKENGKRKKGSK